MGKASIKAVTSANSRTAELRAECAEVRATFSDNSVIMLQAHSLWPVKTAAAVSEITGYAVRTVQDWDAQRSRIPADALVALLQSEWGREFLAAVMANNEPKWWVKLKAFFRAVDVMTMQRITARKLKEALDEQEASRAAFTPSAAALFQDEEFFSGQPSPVAAAGRSMVRKGR